MASTSHSETAPPTTDDVFDLLAHRYRRSVLALLDAHDEPVPLRRIAAEIAVAGDERSPDAAGASDVERIATQLYHSHVPKLQEHGIVSTTGDGEHLALEQRFEYLEPYLELVGDRHEA